MKIEQVALYVSDSSNKLSDIESKLDEADLQAKDDLRFTHEGVFSVIRKQISSKKCISATRAENIVLRQLFDVVLQIVLLMKKNQNNSKHLVGKKNGPKTRKGPLWGRKGKRN